MGIPMSSEQIVPQNVSLVKRWIQAPNRMYVSDVQGNSIYFQRGEVKELVGSLVLPAMQAGGFVVEGPTGVRTEVAGIDTPDPKVLEAAIRDACLKIRAEGDPGKFTTAGRPRVPEVEKLCKEDADISRDYIDGKLVDDIWADIQEGD